MSEGKYAIIFDEVWKAQWKKLSKLEKYAILLTLTVFVLHLLIIKTPEYNPVDYNGLIFDEAFYANTAKGFLNRTVMNLEHPPLAKAFTALGFVLFGENSVGLRIFHIIFGTLSIPLIFLLVRKLSNNENIALLSAVLVSLDTLFFIHSSIAMLDIASIFFGLLALNFYFYKTKIWRFDYLVLTGITFGLSILSKEQGAFIFLTLLTFHFIKYSKKHNFDLGKSLIKLIAPAAFVFLLGLHIYSTAYSAYPTGLDYGKNIISYQSILKIKNATEFVYPWWWITYYKPSPYFVTSTIISAENTTIKSVNPVAYYGIGNMFIYWMLWIALPFLIYKISKNYKRRKNINFELFLMLWISFGYLIYIPLSLLGRVIYPFYILFATPAIAASISLFLTKRFSKILTIIYLILVVAWFVYYFPVKPPFLTDFIWQVETFIKHKLYI